MGTELNGGLATEKSPKKYLSKCSMSLVIGEIQIKMTLRFHLILVGMGKIKNSGNSTFW